VPVGAIAVVLISLSARTSLRIGAAAGLGAATVDGAYALIAVAGGAGLARSARAAADPLHWAAATVLTILAVRTAVIAVRRYRSRARVAGRVMPHTLRHAFITAALDAGVPLRDVQEAASHADPRTTMRYDRARGSLDRHATYIVAAYIAGAAR
jgi:integrase